MPGFFKKKAQILLLGAALSLGLPSPTPAQSSVDQSSAEVYVILIAGISAAVLAVCAPYIKHISHTWNLRYGLDKGECCFYFCRSIFCGRPAWRQDEYADDLIQNTLIKASRYLISQNQEVAAGLLLKGLPDDEDLEEAEKGAATRTRYDLFGQTEEAGALRLELLENIQTYLNREGHGEAASLMTPHVLRDMEQVTMEEGRRPQDDKKDVKKKSRKHKKHKRKESPLGHSDEDGIGIRKLSANDTEMEKPQVLKNVETVTQVPNPKKNHWKQRSKDRENGLGNSNDDGIYIRRMAGRSDFIEDEQE